MTVDDMRDYIKKHPDFTDVLKVRRPPMSETLFAFCAGILIGFVSGAAYISIMWRYCP